MIKIVLINNVHKPTKLVIWLTNKSPILLYEFLYLSASCSIVHSSQ